MNKKTQKIVVGILAVALIISILIPAISVLMGG